MECSLGMITSELCHKRCYKPYSEKIFNIKEISENDQLLLKLRVSSDLTTICSFHKIKYLNKYHEIFGRRCCDPLLFHKKPITKALKEIRLEDLKKNQNINLIPGKSLCLTCFKKIFSEQQQSSHMDPDFQPASDNLNIIDTVCESLNISPTSKIVKTNKTKRQTEMQRKTEEIGLAIKRKLEDFLEENSQDEDDSTENEDLSEDYKKLIEQLKEKCKEANKEEKIKIISLLPSSWSKQRICEEFNVTEYQVRLSRKLTKSQGVLPSLKQKDGHKVSDEVIKDVISFYEEDDNSRVCPGKKDFVSLGQKKYKQKRLILFSLNELFVNFKQKYPQHKIGRSAFCSLRPKWCVLPGSSGTHNVCVCKYHQNVKLMICGARISADYTDLINIMVCDSRNNQCMFDNCTSCPGKEVLLELLRSKSEDIPDEITFMQWVSTDRAELITRVMCADDFFEDLVEKLVALKKHHFISKAQSQYLKDIKENLPKDVCLTLCDFAENFTFLIQDEIQSFHWSNPQATLHPFVFYYKNEDGEIQCKSLCVISDNLEHNTAAVHTFQKYFIEEVQNVLPTVQKIIYFSDGASSQYKNKKNFINICYHKTDFGVDCEWNFFASSHGKNACDGIGGTTKRAVARASLQRPYSNQILTPEEMYRFCSENISGIQFIYVSAEECKTNSVQLQKRFEACKTIPQTRSYHRFVPISPSCIRCFYYSQSETFTDHSTS